MKFKIKSIEFFTVMLLGAITGLTGCATTGMDRATRSTTSIQKVEEDYKQASEQIDVVRSSLERLFIPYQPKMKKAYDTYADDVKKMEELGKQLDIHTEKMKNRGNEYLIEWESSYTNPEIRELSEQRRAEIREGYLKISVAGSGVKETLASYVTDITEIQKFLSNDLTPQGIDSIRPIAQRAAKEGDSLKESVKPELTAIDLVRTEMAQSGAK